MVMAVDTCYSTCEENSVGSAPQRLLYHIGDLLTSLHSPNLLLKAPQGFLLGVWKTWWMVIVLHCYHICNHYFSSEEGWFHVVSSDVSKTMSISFSLPILEHYMSCLRSKTLAYVKKPVFSYNVSNMHGFVCTCFILGYLSVISGFLFWGIDLEGVKDL